MPVVTCAEMVVQCLERQDAGWRCFIAEYLPFAGAVLQRHFPKVASRYDEYLREVLLGAVAEEGRFFREYTGKSEREFLLHLREHTLAILSRDREAEGANPILSLDFESFNQALAAFTSLERQTVWMCLLQPGAADIDKILRLDGKFVSATLAKAQEGLRAASDEWNAQMLFENRCLLIQTARDRVTNDCAAPKMFLRLLDGQITWRDRTDLEHHLAACWRCVDLLCRFREVMFLSSQLQTGGLSFSMDRSGLLSLAPWRLESKHRRDP